MRRNYGTQWAGQFGVAHELVRRGYLVSFTMGNAPGKDLLCVSPKGKQFAIQVKSLRGKGLFLFQETLLHAPESVFVVLVMLPESPDERPEYFVMNKKQFRTMVERHNAHQHELAKKRGRKSSSASSWSDATWDIYYGILAKSELPIKGTGAWKNLPR